MRISDWSSDVCSSDLIVKDRLALVAEPRRAVGHQPLALGGAGRGAEVGLDAEAAFALAAFGGVERDHMIAGNDARYPRPELANKDRALMHPNASTEESREGRGGVRQGLYWGGRE